MKKSYRFLSAVLVTAMLFAFAGCGAKGGSGDSGKGTGGKDLQGRTFKIMINSWEAPDLSDEKNSFAQTEKKFNCHFEFEEFSDEIAAYNDLVLSYLSGTAEYDALLMRGYNVCPSYSASGVLLNMSKYYDFDQDKTWQNELVKEVGVWRGDRYGLPIGPKETGYAIWYNKKLLREANLPDLWEYVEKDQWNFDTFRTVIKKLTKTGGASPTYGYYCEDLFSDMILANGGTFIDTSGDSAKLKIDSAEAISAMEYALELCNVDKSIPTDAQLEQWGNPSVLDMFEQGKIAMTAYGAWAGPAFQNSGMNPEDLGWIYYPKGPDAKDYVVPGATPSRMLVAPANVKDPADVVAVLADALGYWSEDKAYPRKIESAYDDILENDQMLDILVDNNKTCYLEGAKYTKYTNLYNYEGILTIYGEMKEKLRKNQLTPKAAVDSYMSQLQAKIDMIENGINLDDYQ